MDSRCIHGEIKRHCAESFYCFYIILFFLLVFFQRANAQPCDFINPDQFESRYIALSVKQEHNRIRKSNGLSPFVQNDLLQAHADELAKQFLHLGQDQYGLVKLNFISSKLGKLDDPTQKLSGFYVNTFIEEPINYFSPIQPFTYRNQSYTQVAVNVIQALKSYPVYLTLIKDGVYRDIGVGVYFDSLSNQLMVIQLFSSGEKGSNQRVSNEGSYNICPVGPKKDIGFKLVRKKNRNLRLAQAWSKNDNGYDGWISTKRKTIRKAFPWYHFRSGLVLEKHTPYDFEAEYGLFTTPSRNNQQSIVNGRIQKMITRKEITAMWKSQSSPKPIKIFKWETPFKKWPRIVSLKLPFTGESYTTSQILVIRKGKLCNILQVSPTPIKELSTPFPKIPFMLLDMVNKPDTTLLHKPDSSAYQIYYERGVTDLTDDDQQGLLDLVPGGSQVTKIKIHAFASIEGNLLVNEKLFTQRAATIKEFIVQNELAVSDIQMELSTQENWNMMINQLRADSAYFSFSKDTRSDIRDYINAHIQDSSIMEWLNEQRFAWVSFDLTRTEQKPETVDDALNAFSSILKQGKYTSSAVNRLSNLQKRYYGLLVGMQQIDHNHLQFPEDRRLLQLEYNEAIFQYQYQGGSEEAFHDRVEYIAKQRGISKSLWAQCIQQHQSYMANMYFYYGDNSPQYEDWNCPFEKKGMLYFFTPKNHKHRYSPLPPFVEALNILPIIAKAYSKKTIYKDLVDSLYFYFYVNRAQWLLSEKKIYYLPEVKRLGNLIWKRYVVSKSLTDEETLNFALFFNMTYQKEYAIQLLEPMVKRQHPEALMIWISLHYNTWDERKTEDALMQADEVLDDEQWIELVESGVYLPLSMLERFKVRHKWMELISD